MDMQVSPAKPVLLDPQLAERPGFLIRRLHQIHTALFIEECAGFDVTPVQYSIMTVVGQQPKLDQVTLSQEVGVDRATLANVVARLEVNGLVKRTAGRVDKRQKLVTLTPRGKATLAKMRAAALRAHDRTIDSLPHQDRAKFMTLMTQLVDAGNEFGRAPFRMK